MVAVAQKQTKEVPRTLHEAAAVTEGIKRVDGHKDKEPRPEVKFHDKDVSMVAVMH
jgi:hypothetical protein